MEGGFTNIITAIVVVVAVLDVWGCYLVLRSDEVALRKLLQCLFVLIVPIIGSVLVLEFHRETKPKKDLGLSNETDSILGTKSLYDEPSHHHEP